MPTSWASYGVFSLYSPTLGKCWTQIRCVIIFIEQVQFHTIISIVGEGNGTPPQHSCLENPMDGGAWWAAVHGVAKSQTWLSDFTVTFHFHALEKEMAAHSSSCLKIPGLGEPHGLPSVGSHRVGHDWSDLAAAAKGTPENSLYLLRIQCENLEEVPLIWTQPGWQPYLWPLATRTGQKYTSIVYKPPGLWYSLIEVQASQAAHG